ncbi:MAG TPA: response regulator [Candidatus Tectomicrobia bacterium]|nr:response regulator [Candidatus Tectomicrobia bacterium]
MTIVVLDDEPSIVLMCRRVLEARGHTVHGFTRPADALACIEREHPDLLVVDYKMPDLDGFAVVDRVRAVRPSQRVLMITAHGTGEVMGRATEAGLQGLVVKPFTPAELARGVEEATATADC